MNSLNSILLIAGFLLQCSCSSAVSKEQIQFNIPTIEQEASSIWRTINDIQFFEDQGYKINLPDDDLIRSLISKSKNQTFGNDDFSKIYNLLESTIYKESDYEVVLGKVKDQEGLLNSLIQQLRIEKKSWAWDFKMFDSYQVVFTLYGTGGSYDPDLGTVTLFTNPKGEFMNYDEPANTIIHEIVHMGIEKSIVQNFNLSHGVKERIVDTITYILFKDSLPEYKIQEMGDVRIDDFLNEKRDLVNLKSLVEKYITEDSLNQSINKVEKVVLKIDGQEEFFYWEMKDEKHLWSFNLGEITALNEYKDSLKLALGAKKYDEAVKKESTQSLEKHLIEGEENGDRINALLVHTGRVGKIREINYLESQILNYQIEKFPMFSKPTEFHGFILRNDAENKIRVYFGSSDTEWPPRPTIIIEELEKEKDKGWKLIRHLHNHYCKEDKDFVGILAPSLADAQYYKMLKERFNIEKALITNGIHTVEIESKDFAVFESH